MKLMYYHTPGQQNDTLRCLMKRRECRFWLWLPYVFDILSRIQPATSCSRKCADSSLRQTEQEHSWSRKQDCSNYQYLHPVYDENNEKYEGTDWFLKSAGSGWFFFLVQTREEQGNEATLMGLSCWLLWCSKAESHYVNNNFQFTWLLLTWRTPHRYSSLWMWKKL